MYPHWSTGLPEIGGEVTLVAEADTGGPCQFDVVAIVQNSQGYHVVSSSGCSCPSHEEMARYDAGPFASAAEALAHVGEDHRRLMEVS